MMRNKVGYVTMLENQEAIVFSLVLGSFIYGEAISDDLLSK